MKTPGRKLLALIAFGQLLIALSAIGLFIFLCWMLYSAAVYTGVQR